VFQIGSAIMVYLYAQVTDPYTLLWMGALMGMFVNGKIGGIGALMSEAYPTAARATAQNVLFNLGRAVGGLGPFAVRGRPRRGPGAAGDRGAAGDAGGGGRHERLRHDPPPLRHGDPALSKSRHVKGKRTAAGTRVASVLIHALLVQRAVRRSLMRNWICPRRRRTRLTCRSTPIPTSCSTPMRRHRTIPTNPMVLIPRHL